MVPEPVAGEVRRVEHELHPGSLDRHPMVRTDFYSVGELRMWEQAEREEDVA